MANITLKRQGASTIENLFPATTWTQVADKPATFTPTAHTLTSHSDVTITSPTTGQVLKWNGTAWVNGTDETSGGGGGGGNQVTGTGTVNQIAYWTDTNTIGALTTATYPSLTELSYVKGVTSAIQTQFTGKADTTHTHNTLLSTGGWSGSPATIATSDRLVIVDASDSSRINHSTTTFGTATNSFLANNGTFIGTFYESRLTANVTTAVSTSAVQALTITLPAGIYEFESVGLIFKTGSANARAYQVILSCDSTTGYSNIFAYAQFSPDTEVTLHTGNAMSLSNSTVINAVTSSLTAVTGTYFAGITSATQRANTGMPYKVSGRIHLTSQRNFRIHIRQTAGVSTDTVGVAAGSYIRAIRIG